MNMDHMDHLEEVAASDLGVLRLKEATYQGSWKRAGGRSAWFMFRRNLDRLLVMMADVPWPESFSINNLDEVAKGPSGVHGENDYVLTPELANWLGKKLRAEDIFAQIEDQPSGKDGTVLACLRDMRRYATLVEAEMIARGVVRPEAHPVGKSPALAMPYGNEVRRYEGPDDDIYLILAHHWGLSRPDAKLRAYRLSSGKTQPEMMPSFTTTPEAGSQHASLTPWAVDYSWRERNNFGDKNKFPDRCETFDTWWHLQGPGRWVLEPSVPGNIDLPAKLGRVYQLMNPIGLGDPNGFWVIEIAACPPDAREWFPSLPLEQNAKELEGLLPWQRRLYQWTEGEGKYRLMPQNISWHLEVE